MKKNHFWLAITSMTLLLSAFLIISLRKTRLAYVSLQNNYAYVVNTFAEFNHSQKLKSISNLKYINTSFDPASFESEMKREKFFIRIHDSVCLPCSSLMFDYINENYVKPDLYDIVVLGSYDMHYDFVGDIKKTGLAKLQHYNLPDEFGFIGADSLNLPYLFTVNDSQISSFLLLSKTSNEEIDAYFEMVERMFSQ